MKTNKISIQNIILGLMVFSSSLVLVRLGDRMMFLVLQIIFCLFMLLHTHKIKLLRSWYINIIFIGLFISGILAQFSEMRESYKRAAFIMPILLLPLYFTMAYMYGMIKKDKNVLYIVVKSIKVMCLAQLIWIPIQYVCYHMFNIDINDKIFNEILQMHANPSFYRDWTYYPSGFSWHSAILAPLFIVTFLLFNNIYVKALVIVDAMLCGNSTSVLGVLVCVVLSVWFNWTKKNSKKMMISSNRFLFVFLGLVGIIAVLYKMGLFEVVFDRLTYLFGRLLEAEKDSSTIAHISYYTDYPQIINQSSLMQIIFGYGYGCSGYPITEMYNRYTELSNWAVESDIIDILVSRGIVGFVSYYSFLIYIAVKGKRIDYKYLIVIISIMVEGFGYNVQWDYVFMIEIVMYFTIKSNINFFAIDYDHEDVGEKVVNRKGEIV